MNHYHANYADQLVQEINATPGEYLPTLLNIVRIFRESVTLKPMQQFHIAANRSLSGMMMIWMNIGWLRPPGQHPTSSRNCVRSMPEMFNSG